jgi:hypothetical protein
MWASLPEGAFVVCTDLTEKGGIRGECRCGSREVDFFYLGPPVLDSFSLKISCPSCLATLMVSGVRSGLRYMEAQ